MAEDGALETLVYWIKEREAIRKLKEAGKPQPWTADPWLATYRFCNVNRENDRVTVWIRENWREPHAADEDLWFAMVIARHLNLPDSLAEIGYPVPWFPHRRKHFTKVLTDRKRKGLTSYNAAYMIRAGRTPQSKSLYLRDKVFTPMWKNRGWLRPGEGDTLESFFNRLANCFGMGSFMAAQVVADMKYVEPLASAKDWWTFAASGPGSRRGLNLLLGRDRDAPWNEEDWCAELAKLRGQLVPILVDAGVCEDIHAQDVQSCLCELSKFIKARNGGRPKQNYHPHVDTL